MSQPVGKKDEVPAPVPGHVGNRQQTSNGPRLSTVLLGHVLIAPFQWLVAIFDRRTPEAKLTKEIMMLSQSLLKGRIDQPTTEKLKNIFLQQDTQDLILVKDFLTAAYTRQHEAKRTLGSYEDLSLDARQKIEDDSNLINHFFNEINFVTYVDNIQPVNIALRKEGEAQRNTPYFQPSTSESFSLQFAYEQNVIYVSDPRTKEVRHIEVTDEQPATKAFARTVMEIGTPVLTKKRKDRTALIKEGNIYCLKDKDGKPQLSISPTEIDKLFSTSALQNLKTCIMNKENRLIADDIWVAIEEKEEKFTVNFTQPGSDSPFHIARYTTDSLSIERDLMLATLKFQRDKLQFASHQQLSEGGRIKNVVFNFIWKLSGRFVTGEATYTDWKEKKKLAGVLAEQIVGAIDEVSGEDIVALSEQRADYEAAFNYVLKGYSLDQLKTLQEHIDTDPNRRRILLRTEPRELRNKINLMIEIPGNLDTLLMIEIPGNLDTLLRKQGIEESQIEEFITYISNKDLHWIEACKNFAGNPLDSPIPSDLFNTRIGHFIGKHILLSKFEGEEWKTPFITPAQLTWLHTHHKKIAELLSKTREASQENIKDFLWVACNKDKENKTDQWIDEVMSKTTDNPQNINQILEESREKIDSKKN